MDAQNYDFGVLRTFPSKVYICNSGRAQHSEATASTDMSWIKEWQETEELMKFSREPLEEHEV